MRTTKGGSTWHPCLTLQNRRTPLGFLSQGETHQVFNPNTLAPPLQETFTEEVPKRYTQSAAKVNSSDICVSPHLPPFACAKAQSAREPNGSKVAAAPRSDVIDRADHHHSRVWAPWTTASSRACPDRRHPMPARWSGRSGHPRSPADGRRRESGARLRRPFP